jgi:DNA polymerase-3 subunit epsilon
MKLLVFDTETSGLPKTKQINLETLSLWPNIVQLSGVVFDTETLKLIEYDYIISATTISEESITIHGITQSINKERGYKFRCIYDIFEICLSTCDIVIGHNIDFDINMIQVECMRRNIVFPISKPIYCTMKSTTQMCKIPSPHGFGNKWPKLEELHQYLFNESASNLHDAIIDVIVCLRCYYQLMYKQDLFEMSKSLRKRVHMV